MRLEICIRINKSMRDLKVIIQLFERTSFSNTIPVAWIGYPSAREPWRVTATAGSARYRPKSHGSSNTSSF